ATQQNPVDVVRGSPTPQPGQGTPTSEHLAACTWAAVPATIANVRPATPAHTARNDRLNFMNCSPQLNCETLNLRHPSCEREAGPNPPGNFCVVHRPPPFTTAQAVAGVAPRAPAENGASRPQPAGGVELGVTLFTPGPLQGTAPFVCATQQ